MNKKLIMVLGLLTLLFVGCKQETLEERTLRECQEYTRRRCPEDQGNNAILDSLVFDVKTHTLIQYCRLVNESDNEEFVKNIKHELDDKIIESTRNSMDFKNLKDAGYSFRYVAFSHSSGLVLYDKTVTKDDYGY